MGVGIQWTHLAKTTHHIIVGVYIIRDNHYVQWDIVSNGMVATHEANDRACSSKLVTQHKNNKKKTTYTQKKERKKEEDMIGT